MSVIVQPPKISAKSDSVMPASIGSESNGGDNG